MGLTIIKSQQSSGRTPAGEDFKTGLFAYGTAPVVAGKWQSYTSSLWPTVSVKAQQFFTIDDAVAAGIIPNTDNTASTAKITVGTIGATGDNLIINCTTLAKQRLTAVVQLCSYTVAVTDTTKILQAAAIAAAINANTFTTGWTALSDGVDSVTMTANKLHGKSLNTGTPYAAIITNSSGGSGTMVCTFTQQIVAGTASMYAAWHYHISWYFNMYPGGNLWFGIIDSNSYSYKELLALQAASGNSLRLIGLYDTETEADISFILSETQKLQNIALQVDQTFPFEIIYSPNIKALALANLPNGQSVAYNKVSFVISQDGMAYGDLLSRRCGFSIGNIGAKLGTLSKSRVSSDDAQAISDFNISDGTENAVAAFGNNDLLSGTAINLQTQLASYRYIFFQVFTGNIVGTYWTDNYTFCVQTNRYAFINDNRIASKITRICNTTYLPLLKQEVIYNDDGTLSNSSIEIFQDAGIDAITAACITGFGSMPLISGAPIVTVDPTQDLQSTNNLNIVVQVGENGIARNITIYQGFTN